MRVMGAADGGGNTLRVCNKVYVSSGLLLWTDPQTKQREILATLHICSKVGL